MPKLRVHNFAISLDGYAAGPDQGLDNPLGAGGPRLEGGTTFHFVDDGIESALEQAFAAADGADVKIGGGPATIQQYLRAGLVDEMHLAIVPILLGSGERLFDHLGGGPAGPDGYECVEHVSSPSVIHVRLCRVPVP